MSSIKTQKKGLALGAIFALVFSIFSVTPAQAAATNGEHISIRPVAGSLMTGLLTEDFPIYAQFNEGSTTSNKSRLKWEITKVSGNLDVMVTTATFSASISDDVNADSVSGELGFAQEIDVIDVSSTGVDATVVSLSAQFSGADIAYANIRAYSASGGITSV